MPFEYPFNNPEYLCAITAHRLCRCLAQFLPVQHSRTWLILLLGIGRGAIVLREEFSLRKQ